MHRFLRVSAIFVEKNRPRRFFFTRFLTKAAEKCKPTIITEEYCKNALINARVNIISELPIEVHSCDIYEHKYGGQFHAQLFSDPSAEKPKEIKPKIKNESGQGVKGDVACMQVIVSDDLKNIDMVLCKQNCAENAFCFINVPYFADLMIESRDTVKVCNLQCQEFIVQATKDIFTKDIRCQHDVNLCSTTGHINCKRMLMGNNIQLTTGQKNAIALDIVTGCQLYVKTEDGPITTNCVYTLRSKFESTGGNLKLKNVHKESEIIMHGKGALQMEGTRAELNICAGDASLNLQLAYVMGQSNITCNESIAKICISEKVAKFVDFDICSTSIKLNGALKSLEKFLNKEKTKLEREVSKDNPDKLTVRGKCAIELCKLMWIDNLITNIKKQANKDKPKQQQACN